MVMMLRGWVHQKMIGCSVFIIVHLVDNSFEVYERLQVLQLSLLPAIDSDGDDINLSFKPT